MAQCTAFHALRQWVPPKEPLGIIDVTPTPCQPRSIPLCVPYSLQIHVMPPSRGSPGREDPSPAFDNGISPFVHPADIPLPETRPGTMYGTEINHPQGHHLQNRHSINAIDFAQRHPLPESRPTTIMERQSNGTHRQTLAATVEVSQPFIETPQSRYR